MEVLQLEVSLVSFLRRNSYRGEDTTDLLHDIYERAILGARSNGLPNHTRGYVFTIARNLLIARAKRAKIVAFELVADVDSELRNVRETFDFLTPEREAIARQDLQRAIDGMDLLPPRCREVVRLRKLELLPIREIAERLGVSKSAVERQLTLGMRALADFMLGGSGRIDRKNQRSASKKREARSRD